MAKMNYFPYLEDRYLLVLVLLSVVISVFAATMALHTAQIARHAEQPIHRHIAIGTGAIALSGGIWTAHFVGMLASDHFELPHLLVPLSLLSIPVSLFASWLALHALSRPSVSVYQVLFIGMMVGLSITAMHYIDVLASHSSSLIQHKPVTLALTLLISLLIGSVAMWLPHALLKSGLQPIQWLLINGVLMGLFFVSMHYINMTSTIFLEVHPHGTLTMRNDAIAASIVLGIFTILVTILITAMNVLIRMRELYRKIEGSRLRLRSIMETAVDGIITIDRKGLIQNFNHSAERMFGWQASEVIGNNIKMLMPEQERTQHDAYLQNYAISSQAKIIGSGREVMGMRKDGSLMPMRLAVGKVDLPDEQLYVGFVSDITERHALESSLRATIERAERAAAAKSIFLANMSHEIRTPMNAIIGFTEHLLKSPLTPAQHHQLDVVWQSSRSLLKLLNDILDTTKIEKGGIVLESIDFSLREIAHQLESTLMPGATAKHLDFLLDYPSQMPEYFSGDPLRIQQLLINLVDNAIKFTEHGSVLLSFSYVDQAVQVLVRDTGIGMTRQQVDSIFTAFSQADASISRRFGGTGLGTTIARQLVELMGGSIEVESTPGSGSSFLVRLPLQLGSKPATASNPEPGLPPLSALRILVADDVPQNLQLVQMMLQQHGHQVVSVNSGAEAVSEFLTSRFDVVLMDVHCLAPMGWRPPAAFDAMKRLNPGLQFRSSR